jgi:DNA-binding transcriptional regulator YhcF (GntR family)
MTVSKAYGLLEREGVVERRPGRSLVVAEVEAYRAREGKLVELRRALVPAVQAARQLGVGREELVRTVDELFAAEPEPDEEPADTAAPEGERA